jgi:hypothetical protein
LVENALNRKRMELRGIAKFISVCEMRAPPT